jgi:hypothetical protein
MTSWLSEHFAAYATRIRSEGTEVAVPTPEQTQTAEQAPRSNAGSGTAAPDVRRLRRI